MRTDLVSRLLLMGALMATPVAAQVIPAAESSSFHLNVAATYSPARFGDVKGNSFWVQGGSVQVQARLGDRVGLVTDARSFYTSNINSTGVGLTMITATAGPRYTLSFNTRRKTSIFGQVLLGRAMALNGLFPHSSGLETTAGSFALLLGGGAEMRLTNRISVRAIEANRMRTHLPNGANNVQNALLLGGGVVYWFK